MSNVVDNPWLALPSFVSNEDKENDWSEALLCWLASLFLVFAYSDY